MTHSFLKLKRQIIVISALFALLAVVLLVLFIARTIGSAKKINITSTETTGTKVLTSVFEEELKPIYVEPSRLIIQSVSVDINLIPVGLLEDGSLETPKNWAEGGWYRKGTKTAESGNIIINAHYDDNYGKPAAFWNLRNVKPDDVIEIKDALGRSYTYKISEVYYISISDPNRLSVFMNDKSKYELTLITCGGIWDASVHNYNRRLVVKALLEK
jgi:hypothetical protein